LRYNRAYSRGLSIARAFKAHSELGTAKVSLKKMISQFQFVRKINKNTNQCYKNTHLLNGFMNVCFYLCSSNEISQQKMYISQQLFSKLQAYWAIM
jgi:hypothetical protein